MSYKLAIFDMDGTILNTLDDLAASVNYALIAEGYPTRTIEEVRSFVGNGIRKLIERSVPRGTIVQNIDKVHEKFTAYYTKHCTDKTRPYEGIKELLCDLHKKGCKTAVVSNKADYAVQKLCLEYFPEYFDIAAGEQQPLYKKKPAPDLVYLIMEKLNVSAEDTVYIGDSDVDILTAANAKVDCICVDWGFRSRDFLLQNGADRIVSDTIQLKKALMQ
ncbi:MAG: HAD family hydrolase [Ruminococcus sp.]